MPKKKTPSRQTTQKKAKPFTPPEFLVDLLEARSPTGHEYEAQAVVDAHIEPVVDADRKDTMGNRFATVNPDGDPSILFAGHIDELGLIITYIDSKGFVYFDTLGGHDKTMISGRRVSILTKQGIVKGVTGKRAIHLMSAEDRTKVPETHQIWIDLGVNSKAEAEALVRIGDAAVYDQGFELLCGSVGIARAFDDKAGAYAVLEAVRRLATGRGKLAARVTAAATTQEEIGTRGAITAAYSENPDFAIAVDVGHATDSPDCDQRKYGAFKMGGGPIVCRGPNINPVIFERIVAVAEKAKIPYQIEAYSRPTGTDARAIQVAQAGIATGLLSIPLRYMHTPSEVVDLADVEHTVQLLVAVAKSLKKGERGAW
ncbi:MAG: M20/M25/M40 family metallo-hydrolase [Verrucomicrobia bacterium]|nr:M20/M25/M40 family metallo-hydrolase [Verrucomicrobiota bacterium]